MRRMLRGKYALEGIGYDFLKYFTYQGNNLGKLMKVVESKDLQTYVRYMAPFLQ